MWCGVGWSGMECGVMCWGVVDVVTRVHGCRDEVERGVVEV